MASECIPVVVKPSQSPTVTLPGSVKSEDYDSTAIMESVSSDFKPEFINIKMEANDVNEFSDPEGDIPCSILKLENKDKQSKIEIGKLENNDRQSKIEITIKPEPIDSCIFMQEQPEESSSCHASQSELDSTIPALISDDAVAQFSCKTNGQWRCLICQKTFANRSNLQRHLLIHTRVKVECVACGRQFLTKEQLERHVRNAHTEEKVYECDECNKKFRSSSNLMQHKRIHLIVKPFSCNLCDRQFAVRANMLKHQGKSRCKRKNPGPLICDVCNKVFKREFLLKSHLRMHTTEKPFECELCSMNFKYKSTLIRHIQLHNGDRPYSCKICGKTFTHSGLIKPHMRRHTGERPYICPICQKRFSHKHNMQRHALNHNKIKHLICEVCHKQFPKESRLKYHMRVHMADKRPFKCEYCPKSFSHRQNILRHFQRKHPTKTYDRPDTDASVASIFWQTVLQKKQEAEKDYIVPENDWDDVEVKVKVAPDEEE